MLHIKNNTELIFVLAIFTSAILKPILQHFTAFSTVILLCCMAVLCLCALQYDLKNVDNLILFLFMGMFSLLYFSLEMLFRENYIQKLRIADFVMYGLFPTFALSAVRSYKKIIQYFTVISIFVGLLILPDAWNGYKISGNYMDYGFTYLLPAFLGALFAFYYYGKKLSMLAMILFGFHLAVFCNKGSILCAAVLWVVFWLIVQKSNASLKNRAKQMAIILILSLLAFNWRSILLGMLNLARKWNISSYSLNSLYIMMSGSSDIIFSSRVDIWSDALNLFWENPIIGKGLGYLESARGGSTFYAHNVEVEILCTSGIMGLIVFLIAGLLAVLKIHHFKDYEKKLFAISMLFMWLVPLQFSATFWRWQFFWIFWGIILYKTPKMKCCEQ